MRRYKNDSVRQNKDEEASVMSKINPLNKITIHLPSQMQSYDDDDGNNTVLIYLRSPSKRSYKVQVKTKSSIDQIKAIAELKMEIRKERQILFLNGKNVTDYGFIRLQPQSIIHISSSDDLCQLTGQIQVKLNVMNFLSKQPHKTLLNYTLTGKELVGQFLKKIQIQIKQLHQISNQSAQFYLLQSSRLLEKDKSFLEQQISKYTQIICMITQHQLKTRFSNDTKQEILHDISQLLGFGDESESKVDDSKKQDKKIKERYPREQKKSNYLTKGNQKKVTPIIKQRQQRRRERQKSTTVPEDDEDSFEYSAKKGLSASATLPNFKKKTNPLVKSQQELSQRPLVRKIKSLKPKKQIQKLLNSQEKQKSVFQSPQIIKEETKEEKTQEDEQAPKEIQIHKPAPLIPKVMPIRERRKIRLQIQKLFDLGDGPTGKLEETSTPTSLIQQNSQIATPNILNKPIIEELQAEKEIVKQAAVTRPVQRNRDKMRFSMGSRPVFLNFLKLPQKTQSS